MKRTMGRKKLLGRTFFGLSASLALVFGMSMVSNPVFAASSPSQSLNGVQKKKPPLQKPDLVTLNGKVLLKSYGIVYNKTTYLPSSDLGQLLTMLGFNNSWTNNIWVITDTYLPQKNYPQGGKGPLLPGQGQSPANPQGPLGPGTGVWHGRPYNGPSLGSPSQLVIIVNGRPMYKIPRIIQPDPLTQQATVFLSLYTFDDILKMLGIQYHWNGSTLDLKTNRKLLPQGVTSSTLLTGPGAPTALLGQIGDVYIDTTNHQLYGPKDLTGWGAPTSLVGAGILHGNGAPTDTLGNVGDFYLDLSSLTLYGPKSTEGWGSKGVSLQGPPGPVGPRGPEGPAGPQGSAGAAGSQGGAVVAGVLQPEATNALLFSIDGVISATFDSSSDTPSDCMYTIVLSGSEFPAGSYPLIVATPVGTANVISQYVSMDPSQPNGNFTVTIQLNGQAALDFIATPVTSNPTYPIPQ